MKSSRPAHCDQGRTPQSGLGGESSIARYSSRWPSGSRKYTAAAGIQPITVGSLVSVAWKESGVTPADRRRLQRGRKTDDVTVEHCRAIEIADRQVRLEEAAHRYRSAHQSRVGTR